MKKGMLTIGLLGATFIAEKAIILPARSRGLVTVRGIAASDYARAQALATRYPPMIAYEDYDSLLRDPAIDIAYISLHNAAHAMMALDAIHAGKHVIVEKPLCLGRREWHAIQQASQTKRVKVIEAVMCAEHPWQSSVSSLISGQRLGTLESVHTTISFSLSALRGYRCRPELGGGAFLDSASYWLQMLQATLPLHPVGIVGHSTFSGPNGVDQEFQASIDLGNGCHAELNCRFSDNYEASHEWRFSHGLVRLHNFLLPATASFPVNLHVTYRNGTREVITHPASYYYEDQLRRIEGYYSADLAEWKNTECHQAQRVSLMEDIYLAALMHKIR